MKSYMVCGKRIVFKDGYPPRQQRAFIAAVIRHAENNTGWWQSWGDDMVRSWPKGGPE